MSVAPKPATAARDVWAMQRALYAACGSGFTKAELRAFEIAWKARGESLVCTCDCHSDDDESVLVANGVPRHLLTPLEARVFVVLRQIGGDAERTVSFASLLREVWGITSDATEAEKQMVRQHIARQWEKLAAHGWCVESVNGFGIRAHRVPGAVPCSPYSVAVRTRNRAYWTRQRAEAQP